jgi:hypothetical protein
MAYGAFPDAPAVPNSSSNEMPAGLATRARLAVILHMFKGDRVELRPQ